MKTITLEAQSREISTQGALNTLRKEGWIPAVVYGSSDKSKKTEENILLKVPMKIFLKMLAEHKSTNMILELKLGSATLNVVIKQLQRDAVTRSPIHLDFQRISMTEKIEVMVPVHIQGDAVGVKMNGGMLEHISREVKVFCLPKDIPSLINVDVSKLDIGQHLSVKDLAVLPGVEFVSDPDLLVVHVIAPHVEEEVAAVTPVGGAAEPEVILKGKKPEEGEAAAPAKGAAAPAAKGAAPAKPAGGK